MNGSGILLRFDSGMLAEPPCHNTLFDGNDGGRTVNAGAGRVLEAKGAIHKYNDVPRSPERCWNRACGVDMYQLNWPLGARRRVMGSWRPVRLGH